MQPTFLSAYESLSRFSFGGASVLVASNGLQVSFNTTAGCGGGAGQSRLCQRLSGQ
jgi:hypothetical protein